MFGSIDALLGVRDNSLLYFSSEDQNEDSSVLKTVKKNSAISDSKGQVSKCTDRMPHIFQSGSSSDCSKDCWKLLEKSQKIPKSEKCDDMQKSFSNENNVAQNKLMDSSAQSSAVSAVPSVSRDTSDNAQSKAVVDCSQSNNLQSVIAAAAKSDSLNRFSNTVVFEQLPYPMLHPNSVSLFCDPIAFTCK
ncbi:unnamed protein product [Enterobius vermicularis]|uniref:Ovule protein n=1 Tax=Enterobius vermicularis TaxID=51028 RepID=A0A0N4V0X0_ENTVE|nr:unnamed protein product [Enterobius vermicularis]